MPPAEELLSLDATAQANLVRNKQVRPIELVDAVISRIERLNPTLNAVVTPMFEQAREAAKGSLPQGPFTGVPFLVKDLAAAVAGVRMAAGSAFLRQLVPDYDSELVARHRKAGLILVAKTNTPEYGLVPTTEPALFGPTRNPWDLNRTPGGSSGGSAAAVAARLVAMAHANDGGGSIRIPASCCGVFGLKPTRARNPMGPAVGDVMSGLAVEHGLTRSVRDSAALLDATCGPDLGDPYWAPPRERPFASEVGVDPGRLRVGFSAASLNGERIHPDCVRAVEDAARLCRDLGHQVEEAAPPIPAEQFKQMFLVMWQAGCASNVEGLSRLLGRSPAPEELEPLTWAMYEAGKRHRAADYLLAVMGLQRISRQIARFWLDHDIWLTPTVAEPPPALGTFAPPKDDPLQAMERAVEFVPFTPIANVTGQPAMSMPLFWNDAGLPVGTHFMGRFGDEATLFRLAAQLEAARPWAGRRPPLIGKE